MLIRKISLASTVVVLVLTVGACNNVVRLPDCGDCRPVEMSMDQVFEVTVGTDRGLSNDASLHDPTLLDPGTMTVVSEECGVHHEPEDEFVDGIAEYCAYQLEPTTPGETQVVVALVPADGDSPPVEYPYTVIVTE
jgi:hypothetical protein